MAETVEELKKKLANAELLKSFTIKEGELIFVHPPDKITDKLTKIEAGIDCSVINPVTGRIQADYLGFDITSYSKELFKDFDQTNPECKYHKGDTIRVMVDCGNFQTSIDKNKGNRTKIFTSASLVKCTLLEKANTPQPAAPEVEPPVKDHGAAAKDDIPF